MKSHVSKFFRAFQFALMLGAMSFSVVSCGGSGNNVDTSSVKLPEISPPKCKNEIPLERTDVPTLSKLSDWLDGSTGEYRVKKISQYIYYKKTNESASSETVFKPSATSKIDLKKTSFDLTCNGTEDSGFYFTSLAIPSVIQLNDSSFESKLEVYYHVNKVGIKAWNAILLSNPGSNLTNPSHQIFHVADTTEAKSRVYRLSATEVEFRLNKVYKNGFELFLSAIYELH